MGLVRQLAVRWCTFQAGRRIRRLGWQITYVGEYRQPPAWAYSVGLDEKLNHPELVVFDMPRRAAASALWYFYDEVRSGRVIIEDGLDVSTADARCVWRKVHPDHLDEWLPLAVWRRYFASGRRYGLEAFQLVLADSAQLLPWEDGYDEALRPLQPALWEAPPCCEAAA